MLYLNMKISSKSCLDTASLHSLFKKQQIYDMLMEAQTIFSLGENMGGILLQFGEGLT